MVFIEIIIGALLAIAMLYWFHSLKSKLHREFFANALIIVALVYPGFAIVGILAQTANLNWLLVELLGVFIYAVFAYLGVKISFWFLSVGWVTHVLWDVLLHSGESVAFVPDFYPNACIGFDIVFGVYIAYRFYFRD